MVHNPVALNFIICFRFDLISFLILVQRTGDADIQTILGDGGNGITMGQRLNYSNEFICFPVLCSLELEFAVQ